MRARGLIALLCLVTFPGCLGTLELLGRPGHSIRVEPPSPLLRPGTTLQLSVIRLNPAGETPANPRDYDWSSSNPSVGTVNRNGLFTALAVGQTEIACIERADRRVEAYIIITVDWSAP